MLIQFVEDILIYYHCHMRRKGQARISTIYIIIIILIFTSMPIADNIEFFIFTLSRRLRANTGKLHVKPNLQYVYNIMLCLYRCCMAYYLALLHIILLNWISCPLYYEFNV